MRNIALEKVVFTLCYACLLPTLYTTIFPYSTCGSAFINRYTFDTHLEDLQHPFALWSCSLHSGGSRGISRSKPFEISGVEDALKLRVMPHTLFVLKLQVFKIIQVEYVRWGVLLVVEFNLLCFEMLTKAAYNLFFLFLVFNQYWAGLFVKSETSFLKISLLCFIHVHAWHNHAHNICDRICEILTQSDIYNHTYVCALAKSQLSYP